MKMKIEAIYFNKTDGGITAIHPILERPVEVRYFDAETGAPVCQIKFIEGVRSQLNFRKAKRSKGRKTEMGNYRQIINGVEYVEAA